MRGGKSGEVLVVSVSGKYLVVSVSGSISGKCKW